MTLDEQRARLKEWLDCIDGNVTEAVDNQHMFWEVKEIIRSNPKLQNASSDFYRWMDLMFAHSTVLAVRRQLDHDERSVSLYLFLVELKKFPALISRSYHRSLYSGPSAEVADHQAKSTYDREVGENADELNVNTIQQEIDSLNTASENLRDYANHAVAHTNALGLERPVPSFRDLGEWLALLEKLVLRYVLLLNASRRDSLVSEFQDDWKRVFRIPWIPSE
jgi:hypothetical protein